MSKPGDPRQTRAWRRLRSHVLLSMPAVCSICGRHIDMRLPGTNPMGPSVDHRIAIADGGHPTDRANLAPAHLRCNVSKGNERRRKPPNPGRDW